MSEGSCNSPVDIILALDASGSVLKVNWEKSVDFTGSLAEKLLKLNPESRIGVIDFSQVANEAISPTNDRQGLNLRLETVRNSYQNGITRTELALNKALEMFNRINKQGRKKRLLVITDGVTTPLQVHGHSKTEIVPKRDLTRRCQPMLTIDYKYLVVFT